MAEHTSLNPDPDLPAGIDLRGRDFLKEIDHTAAELDALIALAARLKAERAAGTERQRLVGRVIALEDGPAAMVAMNDPAPGSGATVIDLSL